MLRTSDYLAQANQQNLSELVAEVRGSIAKDKKKELRADTAIPYLTCFLQDENLSLEYDETNQINKDLRQLLTDTINEHINLADYRTRLDLWAKSYREYDEAQQKKLRVLTQQSINPNEGIIRALLQDKNPSMQLADEDDVNFVLRNFALQRANQIVAGEVNVLATIDITNKAQFLKVVQSFIAGNEDKDFNLLAPVCCARSHWCTLELEVKHGRITKADLRDPKGTDVAALQSTPAYQNTQEVVSEINNDDDVIVDAVKTNVQPAGDVHGCGAFAAQDILQVVDPDNDIATAGVDAYQAMVGDISENHPKVSKYLAQTSNVAKLLPVLYMPAFVTNHDNVDDLIKLDALMARKLQDLYASNAYISEAQDRKLAENASKQALAELPDLTEKLSDEAAKLAKFGSFPKPVTIPKLGISTSSALVSPIAVK